MASLNDGRDPNLKHAKRLNSSKLIFPAIIVMYKNPCIKPILTVTIRHQNSAHNMNFHFRFSLPV